MMSSDRLETLIKQAEELIQASEYKLAISVFQQSLQIDPDNVELLRQYGKALTKIREFEQAIKIFEKALVIAPRNVKLLSCYITVLNKLGKTTQLIDTYHKLIEIEPQNYITLNSYANALASTGKHERAFQLFERALKIEPNNPITLNSYANALASDGQYERALQFFKQCLQIKSRNSNTLNSYIYFQYALALERLDKYEQAIDQLLAIKMETLTPYQANVIRLHLGRLHYRIKQPEKGNEYFEAAIANSDDKDRTLLYTARSILALQVIPIAKERLSCYSKLQKTRRAMPRRLRC